MGGGGGGGGEGKGFAEPSSGITGRELKSTRHSIHKLNMVNTTNLHPLQGRGDNQVWMGYPISIFVYEFLFYSDSPLISAIYIFKQIISK